jgi:hypothetical protein
MNWSLNLVRSGAVLAAVAIGGAVLVNAEGEAIVSENMNEQASAQSFVGKAISQAKDQLGAPASEESFEMSPGVSEFRIELRNHFSEEDLAGGGPELREVTWAVSGDENLTVWFQEQDGQWLGVHEMRWPSGADF